MIRTLFILLALLIAGPASAQTFPQLTGRIVDQADLLTPEQEAQLTPRLEALERASSRQLVVATVRDLQGYPIEDYGYQLGRHWGIGQRGANNGVILLVAPNERKVRIEVGYGLEPIITDALSSQIIQDRILPRFRDNDYPGGILAGVDSIAAQLQAPPEVAERRALEAAQSATPEAPAWVGTLFFLFFFIFLPFFVLWMIRRAMQHGMRGTGYRRRRRGFAPVVLWGPGSSWGSSSSWGSGSSWGGGGSSWGGGGGFSGGGGSFGGGGASGSW
jgi:uncharacterized protein